MKREIQDLMELAEVNRQLTEEKVANLEVSIADFQGVVQGTWKKLNEDGSGTVEYKTKMYTVLPEGGTSIPAGTKVSMEFRKGYYVAFW